MASERVVVHFSEKERVEIIEECLKYFKYIENKKTDNLANKSKAAHWEKIIKDFNSTNANTRRTPKQIKTLYENIKRSAKRKRAQEKVELYKTGGGQPAVIVFKPEEVIPYQKLKKVYQLQKKSL